jgi:uncharacterized caspase-like protein
MANGDDDWAVVIGVQDYPKLKGAPKLAGANADAKAFKKWLTTGGGLKPNHIFDVTSKAKPPTPNWTDANARFEQVAARVQAKQGPGINAQQELGRRLYIYLSGHGIEASGPEGPEPALLTAEASGAFLAHVAGRRFAQKFALAACFQEVLLFMDCCRTSVPTQTLIDCTLRLQPANGKPKMFVAFATLSEKFAFEKNGGGTFTAKLIEGLKGGAHVNGKVTDLSLKAFLDSRFSQIPNDANGDPQRPEIRPADESFVITTVDVKKMRVTLNVPAALVGHPIEIIRGKTAVEPAKPATAKMTFDLENGRYAVLVDNDISSTVFQVENKALTVDVRP